MIPAGLLLIPIAAALLQLTWMPHLEILGGAPQLALVAIVCWTWFRGTGAGLGWALPAGLVLDLGSGGPLGPHSLGLACASYITGLIAARFDAGLAVAAIAAGLGTVAYSVALIITADTLRLHADPLAGAATMVPSAIWNAAFAALTMAAVRRPSAARAASGGPTW